MKSEKHKRVSNGIATAILGVTAYSVSLPASAVPLQSLESDRSSSTKQLKVNTTSAIRCYTPGPITNCLFN